MPFALLFNEFRDKGPRFTPFLVGWEAYRRGREVWLINLDDVNIQPDGAVVRVIFEQKLDASLDDYSARFVRGLRFEPLPEGKDYVEWGTIPLAFRPE